MNTLYTRIAYIVPKAAILDKIALPHNIKQFTFIHFYWNHDFEVFEPVNLVQSTNQSPVDYFGERKRKAQPVMTTFSLAEQKIYVLRCVLDPKKRDRFWTISFKRFQLDFLGNTFISSLTPAWTEM